MSGPAPLDERVARLRRSFDEAFAAPAVAATGDVESLLALSIAGHPYAIRISELSGLFVERKVVPLPGSGPECLGLAGIRGALVPVYRLSALLGYRGLDEPSRWLVLCRADDPVALSFTELGGHLRASRSQLVATEGAAIGPHVGESVRIDETLRSVVRISTVLQEIRRKAQPKER